MQDLLANNVVLLAALVFIAVMLLIEGAFMAWRSRHGAQARHLRSRLEAVTGSRGVSTAPARPDVVRQGSSSVLPWMQRLLARVPHGRIRRTLLQADVRWTVSALLLGSAVTAGLGWLAASTARLPATLTLLTVLLAGALPMGYVLRRRSKRLATIERQLPDALDLITRALRAGHAFSAALKMAGEEMVDPIASEFRQVHEEVNYGNSLQQALTHLCDRVPLTDLRFFVVAVVTQRESGGNLTEILGNISRLIRDRLKLLARVRVLSAEGRMSGWILALLPFGMGALLNFTNPKFMQPMWTDPMGITMIQYLLGMMVCGALLLMRIVRIRV
jgi:tight adherence protein B